MENCSDNNYNGKWLWRRRRRRLLSFFWNCLWNNRRAGKSVDGTALHSRLGQDVVAASRKIFQTEKTKMRGVHPLLQTLVPMLRLHV